MAEQIVDSSIKIKNARVHNLKGIDVCIPHNKITVITGLSGSGKSSLAFDTLYAEGQRRYIESLSAYVRQFLGRINKPEVDFIEDIPPAIAIEQKVNIRNPHSTVGSSTEIYDYMRLLYARIGRIYSPITHKEVKQDTVDSIIEFTTKIEEGTKIILLCPIHIPQGRSTAQHLESLLQQGFSRIERDGQYVTIEEALDEKEPPTSKHLNLVIDRVVVEHSQIFKSRFSDSLESAFYEGAGSCYIDVMGEKGTKRHHFSKEFEIDGIRFDAPTEQTFNYNSPLGACPKCNGFGRIIGIDEDLVIPNKSLSVYNDAVVCWKGAIMGECKREVVYNAEKAGFPIHTPYNQLSEEEKKMLWEGTPYFHGINDFFKWVETQQYKIQYRVMLARYRGKTICPECHGSRLKKEVEWIKVGGKNITELSSLPISELLVFFDQLQLTTHEEQIAKRLLVEIRSRLKFLVEVGLGYLQLDRPSNTLSGGESQRINLATSIGSGLVGSLYVLDEPSIGLHSQDTFRLINVLKELNSLGNTIVIVEHDEDIIRNADYIIDIGPNAGRLGGEVVYEGQTKDLLKSPPAKQSYTYDYLTGKEKIELPSYRRKTNNYIEVAHCCIHNLKDVTVRFPLNMLTVVTGVSGSGKTSLVRECLYEGLKGYFEKATSAVQIGGALKRITAVEFVDQNPIGKSSRSNPATYLKAFDEIRKLFSEQTLAKQMGFSASYFSTNTFGGGRCEECQGEGTISVEMQFMADIEIECEACHGKKYKPEVLEVLYHGKSIYDVLEMTINQAIEFFSEGKGSTEQRIVRRLKPLQDVGLGYVKLGQSSASLSGGENQRVKLAAFLANERQEPTLFIFDEPTIGLHFHDIKVLLKSLNALIEHGHTVVVIEHNMEMIKCADYIIDMGPEGGKAGGRVVVTGTPEEVALCDESRTGRFLKEKLK